MNYMYSLPNPSSRPPPPFPPSLMCSLFKVTKSTWCCQNVHDCSAITWSMGSLSEATSLNETDPLSPSSHKLPVTLQLEQGFMSPSFMQTFWLV